MASSQPKSDYLSVSYQPTNPDQETTPTEEIIEFFKQNFIPSIKYARAKIEIRLQEITNGKLVNGRGIVHIQERHNSNTISSSGEILDKVREKGLYGQYLNILSSYPHNVTRLDVAKDYHRDAQPDIQRLRKQYPEKVFFSNKGVRTSTQLRHRESDGKESGTFYAGHRSKARIMARVYDKQLQMLDAFNIIIPPTLRVELVFSKKENGISLKDAENPTNLFWKYAIALGYKPDTAIEEWKPYGQYCQWKGQPREQKTEIEQLQTLLEYSPDVSRLIDLLATTGKKGQLLFENKIRVREARTTEQTTQRSPQEKSTALSQQETPSTLPN